MCINYTNETLQNLFNDYIFEKEQKLYLDEGLNCDQIKFTNNDIILNLIQGKNGVLSFINEVSSFINAKDKQIIDKIVKNQSKYIKCENLQKVNNKFSINHYAGYVEYSVENFISKNKNLISDDIIEFLNNFNLFFINKIKKNKKKVVQTFQKELTELRKYIETTDLHFIRCIKPNDDNIANNFYQLRVLEQLKYNGVVEAVRVARSGFPIRFNHDEFKNLYDFIKYDDLIIIGNTKYFLTKQNFDLLESRKINKINQLVTKIQSIFRKYKFRSIYLDILKKIIKLQSFNRIIIAKHIILDKKKNNSQIKIKYWFKMNLVRKKYIKLKKSTIIIQFYFKLRKKIQKAKKYLLMIFYKWKLKKYIKLRIKSKNIIINFFKIIKAKKEMIRLKNEKKSIKFLQEKNKKLLEEKKNAQIEKEKINKERIRIKQEKENIRIEKERLYKENEKIRLEKEKEIQKLLKEEKEKIRIEKEIEIQKLLKEEKEKIRIEKEIEIQKLLKEKDEKEKENLMILKKQKELIKKKEEELIIIANNKKEQDRAKIEVLTNLSSQMEKLALENTRLKRQYLEARTEGCLVM